MINVELESLKELENYFNSLPPKEKIDEEIIVNNVVRIDTFKQTSVKTSKEGDNITWTFQSIPKSDHKCTKCYEKWDINNVNNYTVYGNKEYHKSCLKEVLQREELSNFLCSFHKSGIIPVKITSTENGYWPEAYKEEYFYTNWYLIDTEYGVFKIGWRKRVISVKLLSNPNNAHIDFTKVSDSDVTSFKDGFHAWGYEKLEEYLSKVIQQLKVKGDAPVSTIKEAQNLLQQIKRKSIYLSECNPALISMDKLVRVNEALGTDWDIDISGELIIHD